MKLFALETLPSERLPWPRVLSQTSMGFLSLSSILLLYSTTTLFFLSALSSFPLPLSFRSKEILVWIETERRGAEWHSSRASSARDATCPSCHFMLSLLPIFPLLGKLSHSRKFALPIPRVSCVGDKF